MNSFGVYVHIPFCRTICPYCDFVKEPVKGAVPEQYADALCSEIENFEGPNKATSIFLGGGTPSLIAIKTLEQILNSLHNRFALTGTEITIEANPDDVTTVLVQAWHDLGINRVSLGVQSFDDTALRYLGRRHDAGAAIGACSLVASVFDRWSLDLMFGAQPRGSWTETLNQATALDPPHMSAYGLTYEGGTPFGRRSHEAIDDDSSLELYHDTVEALGANGLDRYEVSNFARRGEECTHNLIYWRNESYAGFGTGAYSFVDGVRARNALTTAAYLPAPGVKTESESLSILETKVETIIQHLRLRDGMTFAYYQERFASDVRQEFADELDALRKNELIMTDTDGIRPSEKGFDLNNEIGLVLVDRLL